MGGSGIGTDSHPRPHRAGSLLHRVRFPYPRYAWRIARNAALLWMLAHLVLVLVPLLFAAPHLFRAGPGVGAWLALVVAALVWLDGRRFHEHLFHADLGASPAWAVAIALATAGALEALAQRLLFPALPG